MQTSKNTFSINIDLLLEKLRSDVVPYFSDDQTDYSHGIQHTDRVVRMAQYLCQRENGDNLIVSLAALLHDIARSLEDKGKCIDHAEEGSQLAKNILVKYDIPIGIINQVAYCIQNHRRDKLGTTLEAKILRDADKLDSLGAICISRVIASSFQSRQYYRPIFDPSIPLNGYETVSALHYLVLLIQKCRDGGYLSTETARNIAEERARIMEDFIKQFKKEWFFNQN
jgi:uncharacterized protein